MGNADRSGGIPQAGRNPLREKQNAGKSKNFKRTPGVDGDLAMPGYHAKQSPTPRHATKEPPLNNSTTLPNSFTLPQSESGIRIYASIAALKAANPPHPNAIACGPAFRARIAPVIHPAATLFVRSLFALNPSIQHSVPEYTAPTTMKFLADE